MALTKSQIAAIKIAAQHFDAGNEHAFKAQIMGLIRSAGKDSQVADIKSAAYDIQFEKSKHWNLFTELRKAKSEPAANKIIEKYIELAGVSK